MNCWDFFFKSNLHVDFDHYAKFGSLYDLGNYLTIDQSIDMWVNEWINKIDYFEFCLTHCGRQCQENLNCVLLHLVENVNTQDIYYALTMNGCVLFPQNSMVNQPQGHNSMDSSAALLQQQQHNFDVQVSEK